MLPKGGWELDEKHPQNAACREAWEEAGVDCIVTRDLGVIPDMRPPSLITAQAPPKASYHFFEVNVEREASEWPEQEKRKRKWVSYSKAATALASRPELLEALNRSSIDKRLESHTTPPRDDNEERED